MGGRPARPALPGIAHVPYLTSSSILALTELPEHLLLWAPGAVGLEFGQLFRRLGAQVTIVERSPLLLPHDDEDAAAAVHDILIKEGITLRLGPSASA